MNLNSDKTLILGHRGMVGSAIRRKLPAAEVYQTDLRDPQLVEDVFRHAQPEYVFLCAARVGGIAANSERPAEFIYDNLAIQTNVIHQAHLSRVKKLLFLGSSCIYPRLAEQPIRETALLSGRLEGTNEPYAVAKIAGVIMCQAYRKQYGLNAISLMPTNLYGPGDRYDDSGHVIAGLIRRFHDAKIRHEQFVTVWGDGTARREFLHVDDLADAAVFLMRNYDEPEPINVGTGTDVSIRGLAEGIAVAVGFQGQIVFDLKRPNGTPRKVLDVSKLHGLGWKHRIQLRDGIAATYAAYLEELKAA